MGAHTVERGGTQALAKLGGRGRVRRACREDRGHIGKRHRLARTHCIDPLRMPSR